MPVELDIIENGHILHYYITDPWTYEDYEPHLEREIQHRESVDHKVHNLLNARVRTVPTGALKVRSSPTFNHRTAGHVAIIGTSQIVRGFTQTIIRLANYDRLKFFDSEEQGLEYLRSIIQSEVQTAQK